MVAHGSQEVNSEQEQVGERQQMCGLQLERSSRGQYKSNTDCLSRVDKQTIS